MCCPLASLFVNSTLVKALRNRPSTPSRQRLPPAAWVACRGTPSRTKTVTSCVKGRPENTELLTGNCREVPAEVGTQ